MDAPLEIARHALAWALVIAGSAFMLIGAIGVIRLPDVFSRQHAAGITDTVAAGFVLVGLLLFAPDFLVAARLVFIIVFLVVTSPTSSHALAQAAISSGIVPLADDWREKGPPPETGTAA
ncbi:MAG: monovalent cation/H(+) antiporter subunit G [Alphaproteobacteria bacterium]|nr:monovalent cation/H(+) antiporter subunit G [Alphaproteobacteria bacterium]